MPAWVVMVMDRAEDITVTLETVGVGRAVFLSATAAAAARASGSAIIGETRAIADVGSIAATEGCFSLYLAVDAI